MEPRARPPSATGRGVLLAGAPTPFLVRKCLMEELGPLLDAAFNQTILPSPPSSSSLPPATQQQGQVQAVAGAHAGGKTALFAPFLYKMHYFTKTDSGQT
jgi:hypothetical protein